MQAAFLKYLAVEKGYSAHTVRSYGTDLRQFLTFCGYVPGNEVPSAITHRQIRAWVTALINTGVTPRSVNRKLSTLRQYYHFLNITGACSTDPTQKVVAPKMAKRLPLYVKDSDTQKLFNHNIFPEGYHGLRDKLVIYMLYFTGIRLSELVGLTLQRVDLSAHTIKVLGKGNKERIVPIHPQLAPLIKEYLKAREVAFENVSTTALFLTDKGNQVYSKYVYRVVNHYLSLVTTLEKKSPHVLRHTFATHLLNNGADLNAIKELLGHANLGATQVYTHSSFQKLKNAYAKAHPRATN
ncbi:MAG: tyrosine-type recombinase/integrase [Bacteroidales bacterium]|nr:tyrosine-type recombinase/integrase [Bacteroidales bacterium]MBN2750581.1 tyrosine-type recombinase/integrase [Bacteroidales bacterium]